MSRYYFFLMLITSISCNQNTHQHAERVIEPIVKTSKQYKLSFTDTISIKLDSLTSPHYYYGQTAHNKDEIYYIVYNETKSKLQFYSIITQSFVNEISFSKNGPDGIYRPDKFYYHNKDSIFFLYEDNHKAIRLFNDEGKLISSWKLNLPDEYKDFWISTEYFYDVKFDAKRDELGFWISQGHSDKIAFQKTMKQCRFNIKTNTYRFFGELPGEFYQHNLYPHNTINSIYLGDELLVYYNLIPEIHLYDLDELQLKSRYKITSEFDNLSLYTLIKKEGEDIDMLDEYKYNLTKGLVARIVSSHNGAFHYIIIKHEVDDRYSDGTKRNFYDKPFSIIVLNNEYELITEVPFEGGVLDFYQIFAIENSLFLSLNNVTGNKMSEDYFKFLKIEVNELH
jgi:hypothetical protein